MITLHVALTVRDEANISKVRELLTDHTRQSREEPECARFDLYQSADDPSRFFILEEWVSAEALDTHRHATAFTTVFEPQVVPLVDVRVDEVASVG